MAAPAQVRVADLVQAARFYAHFFLAVGGPAGSLPSVSSRVLNAAAA